MQHRSFSLIAAVAGLTLVGSALGAERLYERARVVSATPIYKIVEIPETREVCYDEEVRYRRNNAGPTILGTIIGGTVGNQFGGGNGRRALTVAGAALGAAVGNDIGRRNGRTVTRVETQCDLVRDYREEERLAGHRVEYEYNCSIHTTRTARDPGEFIELEVSVTPVGR